MSTKQVAIIGAGASGLTSIKSCLEANLLPVCFERSPDIGGLWRYEENEKNGATVYKSTYINSSKEMMSFSDFPIPKEWPNFLHHSKIQEYFNMYSNRFNLKKCIKFLTEVISCKPSTNFKETGTWIVTTKCLKSGDVKSKEFSGILVCVGHHAIPNFPLYAFPGIDKFKGHRSHSNSYRTPNGFEGKNVLVIGMGNSGTDIAVELSWHAKQVFLSTRRGCWVVSRVAPKGPSDFVSQTRFNKFFEKFIPDNVRSSFIEKKLNERIDYDLYSLRPKHRFTQQAATVNDDLPNKILNGSIKIKTNIKEFGSDMAYFVDGTKEKIDAVIFATGYIMEFPFLEDSILKMNGTDSNLYKNMWPVTVNKHTLALIGHVQSVGTTTAISELQSRWAVRVIKGQNQLPSNDIMIKDVNAKRLDLQRKYYASARHTIQVEQLSYMDDIASQFGAKPNILKIYLTDYKLAKKMLFEGITAYHYRLVGPNKSKEARNLIMSQSERVISPLKTRKTPHKSEPKSNCLFYMLVAAAIMASYVYYQIKLYQSLL